MKEDDFDPIADVWNSVLYAYEVIRERKRNGGKGWIPRGEKMAELTPNETDLIEAAEHLMNVAPAFRTRPIGEFGSEARTQQVNHIMAEDALKRLIRSIRNKSESPLATPDKSDGWEGNSTGELRRFQ